MLVDALERLWRTQRWGNRASQLRTRAAQEKMLEADVGALAESERCGERIRTRDLEIKRLSKRITQTRTDRDALLADLRDTHSAQIATLQQRTADLRAWANAEIEQQQTRIETREDTISRLKAVIATSRNSWRAPRTGTRCASRNLKDGVAKRDNRLVAVNSRLEVRLGNRLRRIVRRRH